MDVLKPETPNPELAAIISCATADEPDARYASVDALNEDVSNYRTGMPVSAFSGSPAYRFRKFVGRHNSFKAQDKRVSGQYNVKLAQGTP